ncbi:AMP-binding protein [Pseudoduganella sp. SL102]|uniref:AMP-binding protein n=1 Tax=Pseudoduganella sp. SL102 TaxID=2995154 RepID=UPI00248B746D|nr:AMP-binding protein [Pseudoduganella sp. SL102]WBS03684.1 AMP-binding protein [Pseudoduganella sp. SL102]
MVLVDQLRLHAARHPGRVALTFLEDGDTRTLTFGALLQDAERIAARLLADLPFARRALLLHRPGPAFLAALCGCWIAGVTPVPTYPPGYRPGSRAADRFARLAADADPQAVLIDSAGLARAWQAGAGALPGVGWLATDADGPVLGAGPAAGGAQAAGADDALALIQYTSGSTGTPRGVRLSHANLAANLATIAQRFRSTPDQVIVSWLPPYHDMGLVGGLLPVLAFGNPLVQMAPASFVAQPLRWLRAIAAQGGANEGAEEGARGGVHPGVISGGPNFAFELCVRKLAAADVEGLDLSGWRVAFCGAETVRPETLRRFAALLAPTGFDPEALLPCYGLAEATLLASGRFGLRTHLVDGVERTLCGPPADGVALAIVDGAGRPLADGTPGEIWIAGAGVSAGYWRKDAVDAAQFGQRLEVDPRHWLRSGDLGYLHDGELVVTGRLKDLIILRGRNVYPADAEDAAARSHPALDPAGIAAFGIDDTDGADGEQLVLACELRRDSRHTDPVQVERAVQAALADMLALRAAHVVLLRPGALPRTTSGKISRSAARDAWLAGTLAVIARPAVAAAEGMQEIMHEAPLLAIAARLAGVPAGQVDAGWTLGELGIDSLASVELLLALEHELGATVPAGCLAPDLSLEQLQALLAPAGPGAAGDLPARLPPSPQQLAFLDAGVPDPDAFIEIVHLRVPAAVDRPALEGALAWLARRHPALRLRFVRGPAGWEVVTDGAPFALERLGAEQAGQDPAGWRQALLARIGAAIGVGHGALAHAVWLDRGPLHNGMLVLALHHLVVDAASIAILVTGLQQAYTRILASEPLPSGRDGYGQWLLAQATPGGAPSPAELDYWRAVCGAAAPRQPDQAADLEPAMQFRLDPEANRLFLARYPDSAARRDALLAAFAHAWMAEQGGTAGRDHALVRLEHHGRDSHLAQPAASAVGWMVSYYPVRIDAAGGPPAAQVDAVRRTHAAVPDGGAGYAAARRMLALREPELAFSYRGAVDEGFRGGGLFPVLGFEHPGVQTWVQACARNGTLPVLDAQASLVGGTLVCQFAHQPSRIAVPIVRVIAARMEAFLLALLD